VAAHSGTHWVPRLLCGAVAVAIFTHRCSDADGERDSDDFDCIHH